VRNNSQQRKIEIAWILPPVDRQNDDLIWTKHLAKRIAVYQEHSINDEIDAWFFNPRYS
jgi:hypothetical protein